MVVEGLDHRDLGGGKFVWESCGRKINQLRAGNWRHRLLFVHCGCKWGGRKRQLGVGQKGQLGNLGILLATP